MLVFADKMQKKLKAVLKCFSERGWEVMRSRLRLNLVNLPALVFPKALISCYTATLKGETAIRVSTMSEIKREALLRD